MQRLVCRPYLQDIGLTERVFQNLLDNAFTFTPAAGSIAIELLQNNSGVQVSVADTGAGIPAGEQAYIFERYKQTSKLPGTQKGMGIGLAIVKKILELHQTAIEVISEPGKGTTFQFVLPVVYR